MVNIINKHDCCGCEACVQICSKQCIAVEEDHEGFLYPQINISNCIDCSLCEKVCPVINQKEERQPIEVYAAKNMKEEIRKQSSSGGVFTILAEEIINKGGVVFGARFNEDWDVVHDYTETIQGISVFRGSKYVQSRVGEAYIQAKQFLENDRYVLFSGTPCQIAGLKLFLQKKYDKLLAVDIICHGVPSPKIWRLYLKELQKKLSSKKTNFSFTDISFRDKISGWKRFSFTAKANNQTFKELFHKNIFMRGFLKDLYLRPSCHACPAKKLKSGSDITLGDFWGIQNLLPEIDDDLGVSMVIINNIINFKTSFLYNTEHIRMYQSNLQEMVYESVKPHKYRDRFFVKSKHTHSLHKLISDTIYVPRIYIIIRKIFKKLFKIFGINRINTVSK